MAPRLSNYVLVTVAGAAIFGSLLCWRRLVQLEQECQKLRLALKRKKTSREKPGLTNYECNDKMNIKSSRGSFDRSTLMDAHSLMEQGLSVKPIGVIRSIYRLCVGTPRQGLLAPNARGCIDLFSLGDSSPAESVDGLEGYSHIWILFIFHLNTQRKNTARNIKSKITPPALGGQRVGIFATRTPHRYNPIGITLCKLDRIEKVGKSEVKLHISGLDVVDGTPVLDIKPYVPVYDSVKTSSDNADDAHIPPWVAGGLSTKRPVVFSDSAKENLQSILQADPKALEFYGHQVGEQNLDATLDSALECIRQVLAIDVRSSYQTKKSRSGRFQAERSERLKDATAATSSSGILTRANGNLCTQQLDNLLIHYQIEEAAGAKRASSENSGAEDEVFVTAIVLLTR